MNSYKEWFEYAAKPENADLIIRWGQIEQIYQMFKARLVDELIDFREFIVAEGEHIVHAELNAEVIKEIRNA